MTIASSKSKEQIIKLRTECPYLTGAEIGRKLGFSREYIRQVLTKANLQRIKSSLIAAKCDYCGVEIMRRPSHFVGRQHYFHNRSCMGKWFSLVRTQKIIVACNWCGKLLKRKRSEVHRKSHFFCNRQCWGKWVGQNWKLGRKRKYDYALIWSLYQEGLKPRIIAGKLGITSQAVYDVCGKMKRK